MFTHSQLLRRVATGLLAAMVATSALRSCGTAPHRQFDFWLGEWEVRAPDGKLAGVNRIERRVRRLRPPRAIHHRAGVQGRKPEQLLTGAEGLAPDLGRQPRNAAPAGWWLAWVEHGARGRDARGEWRSHQAPHHLDTQRQRFRAPTLGVDRREGRVEHCVR